jgi:hypothetical protein
METEIAGFHPLAVALLSALTAAYLIMGVMPRIRNWRQKQGGDGPDALEQHLRAAIPDRAARERLVHDAMRRTGGDRARAIRIVLDDLARDRR